MAYGKRRKSGIVLSGVFIGSTVVGAAQNSAALTNQAGMLVGTSTAKNGIGSVGKVSKEYVPWKTIGAVFLVMVAMWGIYRIYKYFKNPPVGEHKEPNEKINTEVLDDGNNAEEDKLISSANKFNVKKGEEKDISGFRKEYIKVKENKEEVISLSIFSQEKKPNFSQGDKEDIRDIFKFLSVHFLKERLGIGGTKLNVTVKNLEAALNKDSFKKFEEAKSSHAELTDESEVEIEITWIDEAGYLELKLNNPDVSDVVLTTKYVDSSKLEDTLNFFNKIFKKASSDNKKKNLFYFYCSSNGLRLYLLNRKTMDLGSNPFVEMHCFKDYDSGDTVDFKESCEYSNNFRNKRALILKYQYDGTKNINIFDKLFFASSLFENFTEENKIFDFKKNLKFAEGVKLVVKSDTLMRIYCEDDDEEVENNKSGESNDEDKNEVNDDFVTQIDEYLNKNEEVEIEIVSFREKDFKFKLIGANGGYCFDAELAVQYADNDKGKLIEFYNYILGAAYEQKKIGYALYLKDDNGVVKVYENNSNKPLSIDFAKEGLDLEKIKNSIDEQKEIEHSQENVDNIENDV